MLEHRPGRMVDSPCGIQRNEIAGGLYETTIEVLADGGTRVRIPLRAETTSP